MFQPKRTPKNYSSLLVMLDLWESVSRALSLDPSSRQILMETLKEKQKLYDNATDNMVKIKISDDEELGKSEDGNTGYTELKML